MTWRLVKIKMFLGQFYQRELGDAEMLLCKEYVDLLDTFTNNQINDGIREYQKNGPRSQQHDKLLKPASGDLYRFIVGNTYKSTPKPPQPPLKAHCEDITPLYIKPINPAKKESAERIIREVNEKFKKIKKPC